MISPGTASTSRPSSSAKSAVISAPLRSRASTTTRRLAEPGDDPVPRGEAPRRGLDARLVLGDDEAALADPSRELRVRRRVVAVDAAAEHGDGHAARLERSAVRLAVDAARHPADDDETGRAPAPARASARPSARTPSTTRAPTTATAGRREQRRSSPHPRSEERGRRIVDRREQARVRRDRADAAAGSRSRHVAGHPVRERLGDVRRLDLAPAPASAAIVRATRATRTRPRPESGSRSTAFERSSDAASVRRGSDAAKTLARILDPPADGVRRLRRRRGELRRARTRHRDREVEAVEQRARELLAVRGEPLRRARALDRGIAARAARAHVHASRRAGSAPGRPRGRRRGRPRRRRPRAAAGATRAPSAGTREARPCSSTPRCASETSPGRGLGPPPTMAGADAP